MDTPRAAMIEPVPPLLMFRTAWMMLLSALGFGVLAGLGLVARAGGMRESMLGLGAVFGGAALLIAGMLAFIGLGWKQDAEALFRGERWVTWELDEAEWQAHIRRRHRSWVVPLVIALAAPAIGVAVSGAIARGDQKAEEERKRLSGSIFEDEREKAGKIPAPLSTLQTWVLPPVIGLTCGVIGAALFRREQRRAIERLGRGPRHVLIGPRGAYVAGEFMPLRNVAVASLSEGEFPGIFFAEAGRHGSSMAVPVPRKHIEEARALVARLRGERAG